MSKWNHALCERCWHRLEPEREPVRMRLAVYEAGLETCCGCGITTNSGIYVRRDSERLQCKGAHA